MMKTVKKLSIALVFVATIFASACSDVEVNPRGEGDDDDTPIIINPPKSSSTSTGVDTVSVN